MNDPKITTAIPQRRYRLGGYTAVVLGDIESPDAARYRYILALVREGEGRPSFYVTSEKNPRARAAEGSHCLRVISSALSEELESSDRFADVEAFSAAALEVAAQTLGISAAPERLT